MSDATPLKMEVRKRDNYRCVFCGMTQEEHKQKFGTILEVDRIVPGSKYTVDGCRALCRKCHDERHTGMVKKKISRAFGERLGELRKGKGMSQPELADKAGIPVGSLREFEQGRREPLFSNMQKLAKTLGIDLNTLPSPLIEEEPAEKNPSPSRRRNKA